MRGIIARRAAEAQLVGNHPYGYTGFDVDLTRLAHTDGKTPNVIAVKVQNQLPSSRWYSGSGIYRHVHLVITDPVHVARHGIFVTTPDLEHTITSGFADVHVRTSVVNDAGEKAAIGSYAAGSSPTATRCCSTSEPRRLRSLGRWWRAPTCARSPSSRAACAWRSSSSARGRGSSVWSRVARCARCSTRWSTRSARWCSSASNATIAVIGCNGVDVRGGVTNINLPEAEIKRAILHAARRSIVVADGSKLGEVEVAKVCDVAEVSMVITDRRADPAILAELSDVGCEVHVAG